jgi:hypothetical protein
LRDSQIASWVNVSKALSKSIKAMNSGEWNSIDCSTMIHKVSIWSMQDRWGLKPTSSWRRTGSTVSNNRL